MLSLATRLRDLDTDFAPVGLRARSLAPASIHDSFDLAEALLAADSIAAALRVRSRAELTVLRALAEHPELSLAELGELTRLSEAECTDAVARCDELFLLWAHDGQISGYGPVSAELERCGVPPLATLVQPVSPVAVAQHGVDTRLIDRLSAERAMQTVASIAELVLAVETEPARELAKGGLSLPDSKRLAEAIHRDLSEVALIHSLAAEAGLMFREGMLWLPTAEAEQWLGRPLAERWAALAERWWSSQSTVLREAAALWVQQPAAETEGLTRLSELLDWLYPAMSEADSAELLDDFVGGAEALGLLSGTELPLAGRFVCATGSSEAFVAAVEPLLPDAVETLYVQPDLSIIVPGPATPALDRALRRFADVERADLASSFRLSAASITRALATGMTVAEIRKLLASASLTGVPQPVEYLLTDTASNFGKIRVREAAADAFPDLTLVRSDDAHQLELLLVDQAVAALGLHADGSGLLRSRAAHGHVLWVLADAKYPVALENAAGEIMPFSPRFASASATEVGDAVQAMWQRVRAASASADGDAWLSRQVQAAIRAQSELLVEVALPNGGTAEYLLTPKGVANGRMRARDRRADIERTLPLASIRSLRPAPDAESN